MKEEWRGRTVHESERVSCLQYWQCPLKKALKPCILQNSELCHGYKEKKDEQLNSSPDGVCSDDKKNKKLQMKE